MVACSIDHCFITDRHLNCNRWKFRYCSIYLYSILNMNREKHLETILVLVFALGIFYWFRPVPAILIAAGILAFIGIFIPFVAEKIHWAWMKLAHVLGFVMSKVLLTLVYIVFVLPLSFLSKRFRKKETVRLKRGASSYFTDRNFTYDRESLENVW